MPWHLCATVTFASSMQRHVRHRHCSSPPRPDGLVVGPNFIPTKQSCALRATNSSLSRCIDSIASRTSHRHTLQRIFRKSSNSITAPLLVHIGLSDSRGLLATLTGSECDRYLQQARDVALPTTGLDFTPTNTFSFCPPWHICLPGPPCCAPVVCEAAGSQAPLNTL